MCGIYFTNKKNHSLDNKFKLRGPDYCNTLKKSEYEFSHSLLSLTGEFTPQPINKDKNILVFNGQIYNYDKLAYRSDSYFILDQYINHGLKFWKYIDGEYAILILDTSKKELIFLTDIFGTKPLFYSIDNGNISVSSLKSTLEFNQIKKIKKCTPNTIYVYNLETKSLEIKRNYFEFKTNQYKETFDDWNEAFIYSISKRFKEKNGEILLPLSSGLDSGAIACALDLLKIKYHSFTFLKNENQNILIRRLIKRFIKSPFNTYFLNRYIRKHERNFIQKHLNNYCDSFFYGQNFDSLNIDGFEDNGAQGLCFLLNQVKSRNNSVKIIASGQGGDEIYSRDPSYTFGNPNPKLFSEDLNDIFPWENFYEGAQVSYISKEESIGGSFGMETRYPFLDKSVVQEFLNLIPNLKNKYPKSPIYNFLRTYHYPFCHAKKFGFNP